MKNWNWKRIISVGAGTLLGAIALALPPTAAIVLPVLGTISLKAALGTAGAALGGYAVTPPGTKAVDCKKR